MRIAKKSYYTTKLDSLISQRVRLVGKCQRCGGIRGKLECAHIVSRKNRTLRWDLQNVLCLCTACHYWGHQDPLGFTEFVRITFPERYEYLMANKDKLTRRTAKDLKELYETIRGEIHNPYKQPI
jgi:5-methylcytosine-specific restriction endonuclease McrA